MSRVDDDRDAARLAERQALAKRTEESRGKDKATQASAFSKLVEGQKSAQQQVSGKKAATHTQQATSATRSAIAKMLEDADAKQVDALKHEGARADQTHTQARAGTKTFGERVKQSSQESAALAQASAEAEAGGRVKESGQQGENQALSVRSADLGSSAARTEGRNEDGATARALLEDRKESSDSSGSKAGGAGGARAEKGDLKADADKGGGQQGGKDKGPEGAAAQSFRFNPALMAPIAVQKKNETQSSDKLRRAAAEIAQKIVERVRVGTNAAGKMEFQIDLKNDVLGGMSVKVSAKNGKITAVFSGSDKDALKRLEEQSDALKSALSARGLTLEILKTEARR